MRCLRFGTMVLLLLILTAGLATDARGEAGREALKGCKTMAVFVTVSAGGAASNMLGVGRSEDG